MKAREFEDKVRKVEGIRIVLHTGNDTDVLDYNYQNAADGRWQITELGDKRIKNCLHGITYAVIHGDGQDPRGNTILSTIRNSYYK